MGDALALLGMIAAGFITTVAFLAWMVFLPTVGLLYMVGYLH